VYVDIYIKNISGCNRRFLGAFAELGKATISFVMSVRPYVGMQQLGSLWMDFLKFDI